MARSVKPPNKKIWPGKKNLLHGSIVVEIDGAIKPFDEGTVELSMKAPMSVSKPTDLR